MSHFIAQIKLRPKAFVGSFVFTFEQWTCPLLHLQALQSCSQTAWSWYRRRWNRHGLDSIVVSITAQQSTNQRHETHNDVAAYCYWCDFPQGDRWIIGLRCVNAIKLLNAVRIPNVEKSRQYTWWIFIPRSVCHRLNAYLQLLGLCASA